MSNQIETISKEEVILECMDCDAKETTKPEKFVIVRDHDEEFEAELMANGWTSTRGGAVCVECHNSNPERTIRNKMRRRWHYKSIDSPRHLWEKRSDSLVKRCMKCHKEKKGTSHESGGPCKERSYYDSIPAKIKRGEIKVSIDPNMPPDTLTFISPPKIEAKL